jgi:hypothetical protein
LREIENRVLKGVFSTEREREKERKEQDGGQICTSCFIICWGGETKEDEFVGAWSIKESRDSSVGIVLGYGLLGFDSRRGLEIFLLTTASRTALGPTQPPIQWVSGALSLG